MCGGAAGTCALLGAAVVFHGIYNLLIAAGGGAQYAAFALPLLALLAGKAASLLLKRTEN